MNRLYWMTAITNRNIARKFEELYQKHGIAPVLGTVGVGTASSGILDYLGLETTEKLILLSVVTGEKWKEMKQEFQSRLQIDVPGTGIAFTVPMSSVGGRRTLLFLTEGQNYRKGEETALKNTKHELLVVISNQGYSNLVMDAARSAGAFGGTVIHAKGTGLQGAERFLGVSLVAEKEIILIVTKSSAKNEIMTAIMAQAGLESKAKSIVFSLPVTGTAGMRLLENAQ